MMPKNISATELIKALAVLGSHIRLTTNIQGEHHVTIPNHSPIKIGTLWSNLKDVAAHFSLSKEEVIQKIFS